MLRFPTQGLKLVIILAADVMTLDIGMLPASQN